MPFQKRTMRRASPWTRQLMRNANDAERLANRLKREAQESYDMDKELIAGDKRLRQLAKDLGKTVGELTQDDFWPSEVIDKSPEHRENGARAGLNDATGTYSSQRVQRAYGDFTKGENNG